MAFQLALTGLHELSEARWLPSSKQEMALIGPIVRNELFFFVFVFGAAMLLILREWQSASHEKSAKEAVASYKPKPREEFKPGEQQQTRPVKPLNEDVVEETRSALSFLTDSPLYK